MHFDMAGRLILKKYTVYDKNGKISIITTCKKLYMKYLKLTKKEA